MNSKKAPRGIKSKRASQLKRLSPPKAVIQPNPIELGSRLTIVEAPDLHRTLVARLAGGGAIVVDGTHVEEIDTAILQLLTSLWRTTLQRGTVCTWHGASEILRDTANLIGVAEALHFPP